MGRGDRVFEKAGQERLAKERLFSPYGYYCKLCGKVHWYDCEVRVAQPDEAGKEE